PERTAEAEAEGEGDPILVVEGVSKVFGASSPAWRRSAVRALDDVSLTLPRGRTLAVVGESGSGKTTLARCILGLEKHDGGRIDAFPRAIPGARSRRRPNQMVFQDPFGSLNPR